MSSTADFPPKAVAGAGSEPQAAGLLELKGVCVGYRGRTIVSDVDWSVAPNQVTAILGRNGCGKTTLLRAMARQLPVIGGDIRLDGRAIGSYNHKELARRVSYLPQNRPAASISVQALVEHGRFPHLGFPRRLTPHDHDVVDAAMQSAGVWALRRQPLDELSGGERQKAWIAVALAQDAGIILLDEPATWLDVGCQRDVYCLVASLKDLGKTAVMVVHDLAAALTWSDRVCLMADGRMVRQGAPDDVCASGDIDRIFNVRCERWTAPDGSVRYTVA